MQNRYVGDIGDYVKFALLRELGLGRKLGIAWYLYPDEKHNYDGKHTSYLSNPHLWRPLDPSLFDTLSAIVSSFQRAVSTLQGLGVLEAIYSSEQIISTQIAPRDRDVWRKVWFERVLSTLSSCDLVFADPDNGLIDDQECRRCRKRFAKQMPLSEAKAFASGRIAIIYHHNSRYKGGHDAEVDYWRDQLGPSTIAIRANAYNCRTFFVINSDAVVAERAKAFCQRWRGHRVWLQT